MKRVILYGIVLLLCGCDLIEYHPYDVRLHGETGINAKNIARIEEICEGKDTLRFVLMGDSQRCYDETEDLRGRYIRFRLDEGVPVGAGYYGKAEGALRGLVGESRYSRKRDGCFPEGIRG